MKAPAIEFTTNMFGFLPAYIKSALYNYLEFPTHDHWEEIYSCHIANGKVSTVWQAVLAVDPTFPQTIPMDSQGNVRWPRIPSPALLQKAIANVVFNNLNLN